MRNIWRCVVSMRAVLLVTAWWCCSAEGSNQDPDRRSIELTGSHNMKVLKGAEYDVSSAKLFPAEYYGEYVDNITEANGLTSQNCPCIGNEECTSNDLGSTYIWKEVFPTVNVSDITSAIDYADTHLCKEENGFRRVALETTQEFNFLVTCLLCNQKTSFGSANMKLNIMTAGMVDVTTSELMPFQVLEALGGTWSMWDEEVDGTVPKDVVLLDSQDGIPAESSVPVPEGSYSIFLVGNGKQLCEGDGLTYFTWGLMSHTAGGPLKNLIRYVVCEKKEMPFSTHTHTAITDVTDTNPTYITTGSTPVTNTSTSTGTTPTTTTTSTTSNPTTTPTSTSTTSTSTITPTSTTSTPTSTTSTPTTTSATSSTTTTTTSTTTTATTTTTTTSTTTTPIDVAECCELEVDVQLCPGKRHRIDCPPDYSGWKEVECIKGTLEVIEDHCIADWISDVDSMINSGNTSVVDIAVVLKNETDNKSQITQTDLTSLVSVVSNMTSLLELQETSGKLGSSLLHDLEKTGFILATYVENDTLNFTDPTLNMTVLSRPRNELGGRELYFPDQSSDTFIRLPEDFQDLLSHNETQGCVVGFFLDQRAASRALPAALSSLSSEDKPKEINTFVVSMTLGALNRSVTFTPEGGQVLLRLQHAYRESGPYFRDLYRLPRDGEVPSRIPGSAVCVYWDPATSAWVPDGCELINSTRDVTYCSCSHLSMISVITDIHNYVGRDVALDILGTVLSSLSCITLLLSAFIFQFCKGVQASPRISITKQLCVSLFFSHLFLILFLDRDFLKLSEVGCEVVAVVLHYLLTASICWMLAEGLQLFHTVHFTLDPTSFMVAYWLLGYGMPVVVVLVTSLVAFGSDQWKGQEAYAPSGSEYCWLTTEEGYIWAFTGPLVGIIVVNTIFMVLAIRSAAILTTSRRRTLNQRVLLCIKGSFSLNCILGVTWVFGLLYINANHVFAYIFTIFNASQGVMIFVFNCMLNENVWTAFMTSLPKTIKQCLMKGHRTASERNPRELQELCCDRGVCLGRCSWKLSDASSNGLTSGRGTSGPCTAFNRSTNHITHHHHDHQHAALSPQPDHRTMLYNNLRLTTLGHPYHPASRARSFSDVTELERSKQWFPSAGDPSGPISSRRECDKCWREEEEEWRRPSLPAHVIKEAFRNVTSSPHRLSSHSPDLPQGTSRVGSVPARVSPPDQRPRYRKASQWSAETQFSFISDGGTSRKNSLDSFYTEGHSPSSSPSSTCSSSSVSHLSAFPSSPEETQRSYPTHRDPGAFCPALIEEVQRCIHTIPECEERSPSSENTFSFS